MIMTGEVLSYELIYYGTTKACLPKTKFPEGFDITLAHNHCSNEKTSMDYFEKFLKPYIVAKRKEPNLPDDHKCIVISDVFKGQNTPTVVEKYKAEMSF